MSSTDAAVLNLNSTTQTLISNLSQYPQKIQDLLNQWNISGFNLDIYNQLPQEVTQIIKLIASNPSKWKFAHKIVDIIQPLVSNLNLTQFKQLFVQCDPSGLNCKNLTL